MVLKKMTKKTKDVFEEKLRLHLERTECEDLIEGILEEHKLAKQERDAYWRNIVNDVRKNVRKQRAQEIIKDIDDMIRILGHEQDNWNDAIQSSEGTMYPSEREIIENEAQIKVLEELKKKYGG